MRWKSCLWLIVVLFSLGAGWAQSTYPSTGDGVITGIVLTEDDELATSAKVCLAERNGNSITISCRFPVDKDARFTIEHLAPRTYQVFAVNDAEGYSVETQSPGQDVTISTGHLVANVTVHLKGKGGVLTGSITDKFTGQPIRQALVGYMAMDREASGSQFVKGQEFDVAVPADCDLLVYVKAHGYKGWIYTDPNSPSRPVTKLRPGERKELNIQLEPLPSASPTQ